MLSSLTEESIGGKSKKAVKIYIYIYWITWVFKVDPHLKRKKRKMLLKMASYSCIEASYMNTNLDPRL